MAFSVVGNSIPIMNERFYVPDYKRKKFVAIPVGEWMLRYAIIQLMCSGKVVLDVGSKFGYGAEFLKGWAEKIVTTDVIDQLKLKDFEFVQADFVKDDVSKIFKQKFDVVNCMEVLEHVEQPKNIVENCSKLIKKGGFFTFTVPCVDRCLKQHIKLFYTEVEIRELIETYFDIVLLKRHNFVSWFGVAKPKRKN